MWISTKWVIRTAEWRMWARGGHFPASGGPNVPLSVGPQGLEP